MLEVASGMVVTGKLATSAWLFVVHAAKNRVAISHPSKAKGVVLRSYAQSRTT